MVVGTLSFLLFIFSSPQQVITNQLEGYWIVTEDYTSEARESWQRIYFFEECSKEERDLHSCKGEYGWALDQGIYLNLYDRNFFTYDVDKKKDSKTNKRQLTINDSMFDFKIDLNKKTLTLIENGDIILSMRKVGKRDISAEL